MYRPEVDDAEAQQATQPTTEEDIALVIAKSLPLDHTKKTIALVVAAEPCQRTHRGFDEIADHHDEDNALVLAAEALLLALNDGSLPPWLSAATATAMANQDQ